MKTDIFKAKDLYRELLKIGNFNLANYLLKKMIKYKQQGHFWVGLYDNLGWELGGYFNNFNGYFIYFKEARV